MEPAHASRRRGKTGTQSSRCTTACGGGPKQKQQPAPARRAQLAARSTRGGAQHMQQPRATGSRSAGAHAWHQTSCAARRRPARLLQLSFSTGQLSSISPASARASCRHGLEAPQAAVHRAHALLPRRSQAGAARSGGPQRATRARAGRRAGKLASGCPRGRTRGAHRLESGLLQVLGCSLLGLQVHVPAGVEAGGGQAGAGTGRRRRVWGARRRARRSRSSSV